MKKLISQVVVLISVIMLFTFISTNAQTNFWWQTKGIYGGIVYGISSKAPDYLFACSMYEGMFRSIDNGINWVSCKEGLLNLNIISTLCCSDGRILAGTQSGLYYSEDNGTSWILMGLEYKYIQVLAFESPGYIFAGTENGLYRSADNGTTWDNVNYFNGASIWSMVVVPTNGYLYVGTYGRGVVRSTDHGVTWEGNWLDFVLSLTADNQGNVYAGGGSGQVYKLENNSIDWTVIKSEYLEGGIWGLVVDKSGFIYAGSNGRGVFRKSLTGTNWEEINTGFNNLKILSMGIGPSGSVFAGTFGHGIYIFKPSEKRWKHAGIPISDISSLLSLSDGNELAGHSGYGVYKTVDLGYTWSLSGLEMEYVRCMTQTPAGDIFAGTVISDGNGIYKSTDGGDNWVVTNNGLTNKEIRSIICTPSGTIYAGTANGVFKSTDNGANWSYSGLHSWVDCFLYTSGNRLLAGTIDGLFSSDDEGLTWIEKTTEPSYIKGMTQSNNGHIFMGGLNSDYHKNGVFRSDDNGETWTKSSNGLINNYVLSITFDAENNLYAGTTGGVFRSADEGNSWTELNSGLTTYEVNVLSYHKNGYLFAGTWGGSIFRNNHDETLPSVTTEEITNIISSTATSGGNVTSDGGAMVTARGVCWSTSVYPNIDDSITFDGTGTGEFTSNLTGLATGTSYHVRAYATNSEATSYGADIAFSTISNAIDEITKPGLIIYPNPNEGICKVVMSNEYIGEVKIDLIDPIGKVIKTYQYTKHSGLFNEQLELIEMKKGCYILRIYLDKEVINKSLIRL